MYLPNDVRIGVADRALAKNVVLEPLIPFEESPLAAVSLNDVLHATGVAIGATLASLLLDLHLSCSSLFRQE